MGKLSYIFEDYLKDLAAGNISLTAEDPDYPKENSQDEQVALCTRTADASEGIGDLNFDSGSVEPEVGEVLTDAESDAVGTVIRVYKSGGTWGGGDAVGTVYLKDCVGCFNDNANVNGSVGGSNILTVNHPDGAVGVDKIVKNGAFVHDVDAPNDWTAMSSTLTTEADGQVGNCLMVSPTVGGGYAYQAVTVEIGKMYKFITYFKKGTSATGIITLDKNNAGGSDIYTSGPISDAAWTQYTHVFEATTTTVYINFVSTQNGNTSYFDEITLYEIPQAKIGIKYQIKLASTKALQAFFIGNHNFSSGTFDINSYTEADFLTGKVQVEANKAIRLLDVYHRESSAPAARLYWEFDFTNATSEDDYFEFGRIMAYDDLVQITDIEDYIKPRGYGFRNIINETPYGVRWVHKLAKKRERFELAWGEREVANNIQSELRTLYEAVYGNAHPFLFIPDIDGTACYYVYIEEAELLWEEIFGTGTSAHVGRFPLRLIEAVRGKS